MTIEEIKYSVTPTFKKYGVEFASLFGSVARGEETSNSDIDILVSIERPIGIYEFMTLQFELENKLGHKVDLVSAKAVNKYIQPYITKDLLLIYER